MRRGCVELRTAPLGSLRAPMAWYPEEPANEGDYVRLEEPEWRFIRGWALGEAWHCPRCGKVLCVMPTQAGPQEDAPR